jgi:hypothetical protein
MIKLRKILFEQSEATKKLNVLFVTDYPTETVNNFAKRLIATDKVTGEIKYYPDQDSSKAVSLVARNLSSKFSLVVVQISGQFDKSARSLFLNLNRIDSIAERKDVPVVFIATPTTNFVDSKRNLDYIDQAYNVLSKRVTVIELPEINDDSYFTGDGLNFSAAGNQIIYAKMLNYLKSKDSDIEITDDDKEELHPETPVTKSVVKKIKKAAPISTAANFDADWKMIMKLLIDRGLSVAAAAGVAGNMKVESGFKTDIIGDNGTSYGLCQWHLGRWEHLKQFAEQQGKDTSDPVLQVDFVILELTNSFKSLHDYLKTAEDPRDAAEKFAKIYEVPAVISPLRMDYAEQYYNEFDPSLIDTALDAAGDFISGAWNSLTGIAAGVGLTAASGDSKGKPVKVDGKNGKLPTSQLKSVGGGHVLHPAAADAYLKMKAAYEAEHKDPTTGKITKTFKLSDSYRSYEGQNKIFDWDLYNKTGKNRKIGTNGTIAAAYPGTSNHGWGKAIDVGPTHARKWIQANGMKYGWSWDEGKRVGEPWHFTYVK